MFVYQCVCFSVDTIYSRRILRNHGMAFMWLKLVCSLILMKKNVQFYIFVFIASLLIILHDFIQLTEFTVT